MAGSGNLVTGLSASDHQSVDQMTQFSWSAIEFDSKMITTHPKILFVVIVEESNFVKLILLAQAHARLSQNLEQKKAMVCGHSLLVILLNVV